MDTADIDRRFTYHPPPSPQRIEAHKQIREAGKVFAHLVNDLLPEGREKSTAVTKIEETVFWANAGLARQNYPEEDVEPEVRRVMIRSTHPHAYRSGQWGYILGVEILVNRPCYKIRWETPDEIGSGGFAIDHWAIDDPAAQYEFKAV